MSDTLDEFLTKTISRKQQLFLKYFSFVLIDLVIINIFAEYWEKINISSFSISLLIAIFLQVLLKMTIVIEHRVASYFKSDFSVKTKIYRILSAWAILFISKLIILGLLQFIFGDAIVFLGWYHGLIPFLVLVIAILLAEYAMTRLYQSLA